jgi:hypothetical protein
MTNDEFPMTKELPMVNDQSQRGAVMRRQRRLKEAPASEPNLGRSCIAFIRHQKGVAVN